jgi:hypothetical protein
MRRAVALLALASTGFVPPKRDLLADITGEFEVVGTHPNKSTYRGRATIVRLPGDRYEITFSMDSGFRALCLRIRDLLACGWGAASDHVAVAVWQQAGGVTGLWTTDSVTSVGREDSPMQTLDSPFGGKGIGPDGVAYQSSVWTSPYGALHRVTWSHNAVETFGWGIREGSLLIAGFPSHNVGAAFYRIGPNGTKLMGTWMDPTAALYGLGEETLTR